MAACMNCGEEAGRNIHGILKDYCTPKCARKALGGKSKAAHVYNIRARGKIMEKAKNEGCKNSIRILKEEYHIKKWESEGITVI